MRNVFALILFHIFSSDVVLGEPSPYKVLGISRNANIIEIKKAYRKLAKELHPDKHPDDKAAHEKFQELGSAYEILSDKDKRRAYDTYGTSEMNNKAYQEQYGFNPFSAFFDSFFSESLSQPYHRPNKKDPHFRRIFVSFDEVFNRNQRFAKYVFVHV